MALQAAADAAMVAVGARTATGATGTGTGTGSAPPTPPQPPQPPPPWRESPWRESGPDDRGLLKMVRTAGAASRACDTPTCSRPGAWPGRPRAVATADQRQLCRRRHRRRSQPRFPRARTRRRASSLAASSREAPGRRGRRVHWRRLLHAAFHRCERLRRRHPTAVRFARGGRALSAPLARLPLLVQEVVVCVDAGRGLGGRRRRRYARHRARSLFRGTWTTCDDAAKEELKKNIDFKKIRTSSSCGGR